MNSYRELIVWQKSMDLVTEVYRLTRLIPGEERYGLISQLDRAAVSVPSNIAEGYGRNNINEFIRFLRIANGSKCEIETQLLICVKLGYLQTEQIRQALSLCDETGKMLRALAESLSIKRKN